LNRFLNSFEFNQKKYYYCDLKKVFEYSPKLKKLPYSLKILLETNIRNADENDFEEIINIFLNKNHLKQIKFYANRIIMNEFNAVPTLVDFISISKKVIPQIMLDVIVDNTDNNEQKNKERYTFLKYLGNKFEKLSIIPPNINTLNEVNLEYLSTMLSIKMDENKAIVFPEAILGTDLHSSLLNSLGVLSLNVGRLEIQAVMLDSLISLELPKTIGINIKGSLAQGTSFNDVLLTLKNLLIKNNIDRKIVEFYGEGLKNISLEDRTVLSKLVSKYKGVCGYFPIDDNSIFFIEKTRGVDASLIKTYYEKQMLYFSNDILEYEEYLELDLSKIMSVGIALKTIEEEFYSKDISSKLKTFKKGNFVKDNDIVLALIDICENTTNPSLLIQASLVAKKAYELGININKNISRFITFSSPIQKQFLEKLDLYKYLEQLGFVLIENEEVFLSETVSLDIEKFNLNVSYISFSNDIEEIKKNRFTKSKWIFSPALVIAYCLKGNLNFDITKESITQDIYLSDIWPSMIEVNEYLEKLDYSIYKDLYKNVFLGNDYWQSLEYKNDENYIWDKDSTYLCKIDIFNQQYRDKIDIKNARILALLDDNISTDDISPKGKIPSYSATAFFLQTKGLRPDEFDSFEHRYANSNVMIRSILSNSKLQNKIVSPKEGGYTKDFQSSEIMSIYDFSLKMKESKTPLVIFTGSRFGMGEINDWAVKGLKLLGVEVIIAKSFSKDYKKDLLRVGILPLEFIDDDIESLKLKGDEIINIETNGLKVNDKIDIEIFKNNQSRVIKVQSTIDSNIELEYYKNGGVLEYLLKDTSK
jgi:aconitate hydratase